MVLMETFRALSRAEYFPVCLCKLLVTHDSPLIVSFFWFYTPTVVGLFVLCNPGVAF